MHNVALLVAAWGERLDPLWRVAVTQAMRRFASWAILFNGTHLRIVDPARPYARRYLEFDLDIAADDERAFAAFWSVMRSLPSAFPAMVAASERHASRVCRSLKDGVLSASTDVLGALVGANIRRAHAPLADSFEQALTIVYRMLFLLFAEARGLVPVWHPVYRESYSLEAVRTLAERATASKASGLWDTLQAIARLAHAGCRAGNLRVTPFNGRLFAPARTPLAERRDLDEDAARRAVLALSTRPSPDRAGREPIAYRDLGVEQLGAVYETLLDYKPRIQHASGRNRSGGRVSVALEPGSGVRKATGTFYTPQPIAEYLVRRTLGPLVRDAAPDRILHLRVVDPAMGSGAFLVAACRYLADAYEAALIGGGGCHASDIGEPERAAIRRTIAERCLYGVDLNPMAVQLARLSLWLATLAADRPLTFLDHHLQVGDSLLGAWIASLRQAPNPRRRRRADDRPCCRCSTTPAFARRSSTRCPCAFRSSRFPVTRWMMCAPRSRRSRAESAPDARCRNGSASRTVVRAAGSRRSGQRSPSSAFGALSDVILTGRGALPATTADRYVAAGRRASPPRGCFFTGSSSFRKSSSIADGERLPGAGFDAVIGNPPWDMVRADAGSARVAIGIAR